VKRIQREEIRQCFKKNWLRLNMLLRSIIRAIYLGAKSRCCTHASMQIVEKVHKQHDNLH